MEKKDTAPSAAGKAREENAAIAYTRQAKKRLVYDGSAQFQNVSLNSVLYKAGFPKLSGHWYPLDNLVSLVYPRTSANIRVTIFGKAKIGTMDGDF